MIIIGGYLLRFVTCHTQYGSLSDDLKGKGKSIFLKSKLQLLVLGFK